MAAGKKVRTPDVEKSSSHKEGVAKSYNLSNSGELISLLQKESDDAIKKVVGEHLVSLATKYDLEQYTILALFDDCDSLSSFHANQIYEAASKANSEKDILLVVHSLGGKIEPAYLISKTCKKLSKAKFVVAVPRKAKSAATLTTLGADEIHMGLMSELGPIDPQIGGYPALGLSNALNKLAELASRFPGSSDMFAAYLSKNLDLKDVGYFERVSESAAQYAERLLANKKFPSGHTATSLSNHFVNHYKDHGFVIDMDEALDLLGDKIIKTDSSEYYFANEVYSFFDSLSLFLRVINKKEFWLVRSILGPIGMRERK